VKSETVSNGEYVSSGAEQLPLLGLKRVAVVRSEKLIAEAKDISGSQRKENVRQAKAKED
jgi:hypothetical protein